MAQSATRPTVFGRPHPRIMISALHETAHGRSRTARRAGRSDLQAGRLFPMIALRDARADELSVLSDLCLRSKAVWGYDAAFIAACRDELTLTPADIASTCLQVAADRDGPLGVAQLSIGGDEASLLKLFVEPRALRSGIGSALLAWSTATATRLGARRLVIEADPGAVPFYARHGAHPAGHAPSGSIPGRMLPRLVITLAH